MSYAVIGLEWINSFILYYVVFVAGFYLVLLCLSSRQLIEHSRRKKYDESDYLTGSEDTPPVSILIPAYNEEPTIVENVYSFLNVQYPDYEVIIINDGSSDQTLQVLIEHFQLVRMATPVRIQLKTERIIDIYQSIVQPNLKVINKVNGGKADALNAGLNVSSYPYFCAVDADSVLEHNALLKTMRPFLEGEEDIIACGGIVRIANGCKIIGGRVLEIGLPKESLAIYQVIEYLRSFFTGRLGFSSINSLLIVSGAFGVFRKKEVLEIGGYSRKTIGEDMELVIRLQRKLYDEKKESKVLFLPDPVCWTEAPVKLKQLNRQRSRWQLGLIQCLWIHKKALFNPKYKTMGMLSLPYFLFIELLGPVIELFGLLLTLLGLYLGYVSLSFAMLFLSATVLFGVFLSLSSILMEEYSQRRYPKISDFLTLVFYCFVEGLWYRQLTAIMRTWAFLRLLKKDSSWGEMKREGFK